MATLLTYILIPATIYQRRSSFPNPSFRLKEVNQGSTIPNQGGGSSDEEHKHTR